MDNSFNTRLLKLYLSVVETNAKRLLDSLGADFVYIKFIEEYYSLLLAMNKLEATGFFRLKKPVRIQENNKTVIGLFMSSDLKCQFHECQSSALLSNLSFFSIQKIAESIMNQIEDL